MRYQLGFLEDVDSFLGSVKCADMDDDGDMDVVFTSDNHSISPMSIFIYYNP